jgi:hypothetical protein
MLQIAKQVDFVQEELKRLTDGPNTRPVSASAAASNGAARPVAYVSVDEAMARAAAMMAARQSQDGSY